jgi:DNA repair exonuclease SbcCD ATPase subunit
MVKMLLTHPDVETDVRNYEYKSPVNCIARGFENTIKLEFEKAQKGKQLLTVLSRNIYLAKTLLNQDLNPNCWERNKNGEIKTPLSLIIKSCLRTITRDKEEVLTKLLKHKELDFSQIKQIQAIEKNLRLGQIIAQAITERLTDVINRKDLDDVKKLVEDNCFMNYAVVAAALRDVGNPIESIANYLNEKFPASVKRPLAGINDIPVDFEEFVQELVNELEKVKVQLAEKEKELNGARQELNKRNDEIGKQQNRILELERELHHAKIRLAKGGIKKSAEDNCFMSCIIVTTASGNVNKKFPASAELPLASTDSAPVGFEQGVAKLADKLENVQAQLAEKEKELGDIKQELNKRNNEIREQQNRIAELERELDQTKAQLTEKDRKLNNTREESNGRIHQVGKESGGRANSPGGKQNNYALTFFILCGICAGGACLTIVNYPEVSAGLAVVALGLFLVGYFLYKGDEKDIGPGSATDNPQVTGFYSFSRFC